MALLLTEADIRELLEPLELITAMQDVLAAFSSGQADQPVRTAMRVGPQAAFFGVMPAYLARPAALGAKLVTVFNENAAHRLPTHFATIILLDPETGAVLAVMDGRYITAMRTAAVSAVAVRWLAETNSSVLAILGAGVQARSHVEILTRIRRFEQIRAWSPTREHLDRFVSDAAAKAPLPISVASGAEEAICGADVIVLATSSRTPVIDSRWVTPGSLVISLGAYQPDMREMDPALVSRARLIVDSRAAALAEAGDIVQGIREGRFTATKIGGEMGEVILGQVPARLSTETVTIFKSLGMAVEDIGTAHWVYTRARERGKGREILF